MLYKLEDILNIIDGRVLSGDPPAAVDLIVAIDSRKAVAGSLFFALSGENFDGHDFAVPALEKGAWGAVVTRPVVTADSANGTIICVNDVLTALQALAADYLQRCSVVSTAVTGSVGKTTTKELVSFLLGQAYSTHKTEGNLNNDIGLPLSIFALNENYERAVFEMAMRARGEIKRLARIVRPQYALITNIAPVHLEMLGSLEEIAAAKCEVLEELAPDGWGIVNGDIPLLVTKAMNTHRKILRFGWNSGNDARIIKVEADPGGMTMEIDLAGELVKVNYPVPAPDLAPDFAAAMLCVHLQGIGTDVIEASPMGDFVGVDKRLNITELKNGGIVINDSYNASPLSMNAALGTLAIKAAGRRSVAVLGDMFELGTAENDAHITLGKEVVRRGINRLVCIGRLTALTAESAIASGMPDEAVLHFADQDTALEWLKNNADPGDVILFKASRGMQLDIIARHVIEAL